MKYILTFAIVLCIFGNVKAQSQGPTKPQATIYSNDGYVISCGGALITAGSGGGGYSGSATVGLPFIGTGKAGTLECKSGLFVGPPKKDTLQKGVSVPLENNAAIVFPNPTSGNITLSVPKNIGAPINIKLFDEHGSDLGQIKYNIVGEQLHAQIQNKANGIYFIRMESRKFSQIYKITLVK